MDSFTYKLIRVIAYAILAVGVIFIVIGLIAHTSSTLLGALVVFIASALFSSLFLFFMKVIEQNEERNEQNAKLIELIKNGAR